MTLVLLEPLSPAYRDRILGMKKNLLLKFFSEKFSYIEGGVLQLRDRLDRGDWGLW